MPPFLGFGLWLEESPPLCRKVENPIGREQTVNARSGYPTEFKFKTVFRLLVIANVVHSSSTLTLMIEAIHSSETPALTRATRRKIPEYAILHSHCH
jgi:hypothetical protein